MPERFLGLREVAKIFGVTPLTLRNWDKRGRLIAYRNPINNYRVYRYADIADLLTAIQQGSPRLAAPLIQRLAVRVEVDRPEPGSIAESDGSDVSEDAI